jgi:MFS family permease
MFISALDQTIVATAIPTITHDLSSASGYVWIGGAYLLSNAASGPIWAKISDIFGRKPIILAANALFFLASILCAKATSMKMLIIGRTFQGVGCGGLGPLVIITISDLFSMRYVFSYPSENKY